MGQSPPKLPPKTVLQTAGALLAPSRPQPPNSRGENAVCKREGPPGPTPAARPFVCSGVGWGWGAWGAVARRRGALPSGGSGGRESSVLPVAAAAAAAIKRKKKGGGEGRKKIKINLKIAR